MASYSSSVPAFLPSLSPLLPRYVFRAAVTTHILACISASPLSRSPSLHSHVDALPSQVVVSFKCGCARERRFLVLVGSPFFFTFVRVVSSILSIQGACFFSVSLFFAVRLVEALHCAHDCSSAFFFRGRLPFLFFSFKRS